MQRRVTPDALSRLLAEHGRALALAASHWTTTAEDCVQEALVELAGLPRAPDNPVAWLYARIRQRALNAARAARRRSGHEEAAWRERLEPASGGVDPAEAADLVEALATLTDAERELVTLRFYSGLSYADLAGVVGGSKSAVHRATEAAIAKLREAMDIHPEGVPPCKT
jgi:RNA polymerase sigma-70 factor (ECF subfamily)